MSITDELREWGRATLMPSLLVRMEAIADRIDAEHESACAEAYGNGVMSVPIALDESAWVELPKDADGEYIRIGDVMELVSYDEDYRPVIRTVNAVGEQVFFAWSKENGRYAQYEACAYRHHAPTVEDVLREFAGTLASADNNWGSDVNDAIAEYAKRLTLAEGEDA